MKRRVLSFMITLALGLNLCPVWVLAAAEEETGSGRCSHHPVHTEVCGYAPEPSGAPCTFVCQICPIEDLMDKLPSSVSEYNSEQVYAQLSVIYDLYDELTGDEQQQVDLSPCVSLQEQIDQMGAAAYSDTADPDKDFWLTSNVTRTTPYEVSVLKMIDTRGFTLTASETVAIQVTGTGEAYLKGKVVSKKGAGVEVQSGGFLSVTGSDTHVSGTICALDVAAGARVQLSAGTYFGKGSAIQVADGDFAALLAPGCGYFDADGNPILPKDVADAKTVIVKLCTDHSGKEYTHIHNTVTHTWTCPICKTEGTEPCTFTFAQDGNDGVCDLCGGEITVEVDRDSLKALAYDGSVKPAAGTVTVKVKGGGALPDTDYTVSYATSANVGNTDITVTVTVVVGADNGTFTKDYTFTRDELAKPVLEWDTVTKPVPVTVPYDGDPVEPGDLPPVIINIAASEDLHQYLQYSYMVQGDSAYTDGLPTNAGTYQVVVSLPEKPGDASDYQAASSEPIALTIEKISPIVTPPAARTLTFNGSSQDLVTAGTLHSAAARDGVEIKFATGQNDTYSTTIPTGINAVNYTVWYRTEETENFLPVDPTRIDVTIQPKRITPRIELSGSSYVYDGGNKKPKVTVKDETIVIDEAQYTVTWRDEKNTVTDNLTAVGTYTATIENVSDGNYTFTETAKVEIVPAAQGGLTIIGKPEHVRYGDTVTTLDAIGGSENGKLTWSITPSGNSTIDPDTGELTVKDTGTIIVKAEREVPNYGTVSDELSITVEPKPVEAVVTVAAKYYDRTTSIAPTAITAIVDPGDLVDPGDRFTISDLTGVYADANAGKGKTVTLNTSQMTTTADPAKYTVTCLGTATADIDPRSVTVTVSLSGNDLQTDNTVNPPKYSYDYDGTDKTPNVTVTGSDAGGYTASLAASDYTVEYSNNKNVGTGSVTVKSATEGNYTFTDVKVEFSIKKAAAKLIRSPQANALEYNRQPQELVSVGEASGGHIEYSLVENDNNQYSERVPTGTGAGDYTVYYKVVPDSNHTAGANEIKGSVAVRIRPREIISPVVTVSGSYTYNGSEQEPAGANVVVKDGSTTIPASEYTLSYRDNINAGTGTVIVVNANGGNYIVNGEGTFTIDKANASVTAPTNLNLPYNGTPQALVQAGSPTGGTLVYSLTQGGGYSPAIPTGVAVGSYPVYYKVQGDSNHNDSQEQSVTASIIVNTVSSPTVQVTPQNVTYTSEKQEPTVTVKDDKGFLIDSSEYTVTYADASGNDDLTSVGTYTVTIQNTANANYTINDSSATFTILPADQEALTITNTREQVYYGDKIQLDTTGGNGTVTWTVDNGAASIDANGLLTITGVGSVKVTATSTAPGYTNQTTNWSFYADRKPVTAVVTAQARTYVAGDTTATVTAVLQSSDLVGSDNIKITLSGSFEDPNVGTDKKVVVDSTNPIFTSSTGNSANYNITYPATTTASILKANIASQDITSPTAKAGLTYTGLPLALVQAGSATGGTMEYSTDDSNYSVNLPTGTEARSYDVWYRVKGDGNHNDTAAVKLSSQVPIDPLEVTPNIELSPNSLPYDGQEHKPAVEVTDISGRTIPRVEYAIGYGTTDWKTVGDHTITITNAAGGNYKINEQTATFTITAGGQGALTIENMPGKVQYGDTFQLVALLNGSLTDNVTWKSSAPDIADINPNTGAVKVLKSGGPVTITATRAGGGNYDDVSATRTFSAEKKPVTAVVTAKNREYAPGDTSADLVVTWTPGDILSGDDIKLLDVLTGTFDDANVGTGKPVTIRASSIPSGSDHYAVSWNETTTASITPKAATVTGVTGKADLKYTGSPQELVNEGSADGGYVAYSRDGINFTLAVPQETNAGSYNVWYKALAAENYKDSGLLRVTVAIAKAKPAITNPTATGTEGETLSQIALNGGKATANGKTVPGEFTWKDGDTEPANGQSYDVIFTPDDTANYETITFQIAVTVNSASGGDTGSDGTGGDGTDSGNTGSDSTGGDGTDSGNTGSDGTGSDGTGGDGTDSGNTGSDGTGNDSTGGSGSTSGGSDTSSTTYSVNTPMQTTVKNGTASTVLSAAGGSRLVREAAANQSESVVIKPEITGDVTKAEVSIPASTLSQIQRETNASLTVSTPVADVTIPNAALDTLSSPGGTLNVAAEQVDQTVVLTLTAGGETVESVPGGVTISVPAEDAGPGTVAVLVHEDGTRETIRKSIAEDGKVNIPLNGSATVEIVDNSKDFTDVPSTSWAADAVAFASAHELFSGTSETTFSPDEPMSRGMLATVLYSLEGGPEHEQAGEFSDVSSDTWYADSIAWATENGIAAGYGDGQFGPDDSITREQLVLMLWKYAGSPESNGQALDFTDADQASDYALEALRWAAEKNILSGYGNGQLDPGGTATRAQAAQMLKNFMEST